MGLTKSPGQIAYEAYFSDTPGFPAWERQMQSTKLFWNKVGVAFTSIRVNKDEQTDESSGVFQGENE